MDLPHTAGDLDREDAISALSAHVRSHKTATLALATWCELYGIGEGPVRTEILDCAVTSRSGHAIGYRRIRLMCGEAFLSNAEIRFRCEALNPAMMLELEQTDAPFGKVVAPLKPHRVTTFMQGAGDRHAECILIHHATVLDGRGQPVARVREAYQKVLIR